jgi:hypothetical protein
MLGNVVVLVSICLLMVGGRCCHLCIGLHALRSLEVRYSTHLRTPVLSSVLRVMSLFTSVGYADEPVTGPSIALC